MGDYVQADWLRAIVEVIEEDTEVAALLTTSGLGVYAFELPRAITNSMPDHAVVVKPVGGPGSESYLPLAKNRIDIWHYGGSLGAAMTLQRNVNPVMKQLTRVVKSTNLIHSIVHSAGPLSIRDKDESWPISVETWLVIAADH